MCSAIYHHCSPGPFTSHTTLALSPPILPILSCTQPHSPPYGQVHRSHRLQATAHDAAASSAGFGKRTDTMCVMVLPHSMRRCWTGYSTTASMRHDKATTTKNGYTCIIPHQDQQKRHARNTAYLYFLDGPPLHPLRCTLEAVRGAHPSLRPSLSQHAPARHHTPHILRLYMASPHYVQAN